MFPSRPNAGEPFRPFLNCVGGELLKPTLSFPCILEPVLPPPPPAVIKLSSSCIAAPFVMNHRCSMASLEVGLSMVTSLATARQHKIQEGR